MNIDDIKEGTTLIRVKLGKTPSDVHPYDKLGAIFKIEHIFQENVYNYTINGLTWVNYMQQIRINFFPTTNPYFVMFREDLSDILKRKEFAVVDDKIGLLLYV